MNRDFILSIYRELRNEFKSSEGVYVVAFDTNGYYYGLASDEESLERILSENIYKQETLMGLVGDNLGFENVGYDIPNERVVSNQNLLKETNALEYAKEQLILSTDNKVENLKLDLNYGNELVENLHKLLSEEGVSAELDVISLDDEVKDQVPEFKILFVEESDLSILVTGQMMCFMTSVGVVKIHDVNRDINFKELVTLLSFIWKVNFNKLLDVLSL